MFVIRQRSLFLSLCQHRLFFLLISFLLATVVFLKNAWVSEDAYINFRSIEQLFAGNGPVWNPHERVQVFTSPLWYALLAFFRLFSSNLFLLTIVISLILLLATLWLLRLLLKSDEALFISVLLFVASTAFFDFTSSGLENGLAYLLLVLYVTLFLSVAEDHLPEQKGKKKLACLILIAGLIVLTRHDLLILILPSLIYAVWSRRRFYSLWGWTRTGNVQSDPFLGVYPLFIDILRVPSAQYGLCQIEHRDQSLGVASTGIEVSPILN